MDSAAELKEFCKASGADIAGIADLASRSRKVGDHPCRYPGFPISGLSLLRYALMAISWMPLPNCRQSHMPDHYRAAVNVALDRLTARIERMDHLQGNRSEAVPASKIEETEKLLGAVSHKAIAVMAGIGWQGKSLLIVNPEHGPRIRLATVLTDMPLAPDMPIRQRCGSCDECAKACPAEAIRDVTREGKVQKQGRGAGVQTGARTGHMRTVSCPALEQRHMRGLRPGMSLRKAKTY